MLTATYTLVALSVEQASVRVSLQSFQKYLQANFVYQSMLTPGQVEFACKALQRLYETCHWYKIDTFLLPAINESTQDASALVQEIESLNRTAADLLATIDACRHAALVDSEAKVAQFCGAVDAFCLTLLKRLELEEQRLFPFARSVISGEAWFSIANQLLVHDAQKQERRQARPIAMHGAGAAAPLDQRQPQPRPLAQPASLPQSLPLAPAPPQSQPDLSAAGAVL